MMAQEFLKQERHRCQIELGHDADHLQCEMSEDDNKGIRGAVRHSHRYSSSSSTSQHRHGSGAQVGRVPQRSSFTYGANFGDVNTRSRSLQLGLFDHGEPIARQNDLQRRPGLQDEDLGMRLSESFQLENSADLTPHISQGNASQLGLSSGPLTGMCSLGSSTHTMKGRASRGSQSSGSQETNQKGSFTFPYISALFDSEDDKGHPLGGSFDFMGLVGSSTPTMQRRASMRGSTSGSLTNEIYSLRDLDISAMFDSEDKEQAQRQAIVKQPCTSNGAQSNSISDFFQNDAKEGRAKANLEDSRRSLPKKLFTAFQSLGGSVPTAITADDYEYLFANMNLVKRDEKVSHENVQGQRHEQGDFISKSASARDTNRNKVETLDFNNVRSGGMLLVEFPSGDSVHSDDDNSETGLNVSESGCCKNDRLFPNHDVVEFEKPSNWVYAEDDSSNDSDYIEQHENEAAIELGL